MSPIFALMSKYANRIVGAHWRRLLQYATALLISVLALGAPRVGHTQAPPGCANSKYTWNPCTIETQAYTNTTDTLQTWEQQSVQSLVQQSSFTPTNPGFSCTYTAPVTSCTVPAFQTVNGNYGQLSPIKLYYTVGSSYGTGTIIVTMPQRSMLDPVIRDTIMVFVPDPHDVQVIRDWSSEFSNTVVPNGAGWSTFHVQNTGGGTTTYNLSAACTGTLTSCTLSRTTVSVAPFGDSTVRVNLLAGAEGTTGNVTVTATAQGDTSHSSDGVTLTATAYWWYTATPDFTRENQIESPALCVNACFAAAASVSTVSYARLGQSNAITLVYNGDHVALRPIIGETLNYFPGHRPVDTLLFSVLDSATGVAYSFTNGETVLRYGSAGPATRAVGQLALSPTKSTGVYPVILSAQGKAGAASFTTTSVSYLLVDNERRSTIARGWTVAGVQRLYVISSNNYLVTEGDGTAIHFGPSGPPPGQTSTISVSGSNYIRRYADSSTVTFNSVGLMTQATDRFGHSRTLTYDGSNRLSTISDLFNPSVVTTFAYGMYGLASITEPTQTNGSAGRVTSFVVNSDSSLVTVTDPDGVSTNFGYDTQKRLSRTISRRGDTTTFVYDSLTWKVVQDSLPRIPVDAGGGTTTLQRPVLRQTAWQTVGLPRTATTPTPAPGLIADTAQGIVQDAVGNITRWTANKYGQILQLTEPGGRITTSYISLPAAGPDSVKTALGGIERYWHQPTYLNGSATGPGYNLIKQQLPGQQDTTIVAYSTAYNIPISIVGGGNNTQYTLGTHGALTAVIEGGRTTIHRPDSWQRDTMVVDPLNHQTRWHYDALTGNVDTLSTDGTGGVYAAVTVYRYDGYGRDTASYHTGQAWYVTHYDALNRTTSVKDLITNQPVSYGYDALYRTRVQDAKGQVFRNTVNALGWVTAIYDPADTLNRYTSYRYDAAGHLTSFTNRRLQRATFTYDSAGRVISKGGDNVTPATFAYKNAGRILCDSTATSTDSIGIDANGLVTVVMSRLGGHRFWRAYTYDSQRRLNEITSVSDAATYISRQIGYDATTGQVSSVTLLPGYTAPRVTSLARNGDGVGTGMTWGIGSGGTRVRTDSVTGMHMTAAQTFTIAALSAAFWRGYGTGPDAPGQLLVALSGISATGTPNDSVWFRRIIYDYAGRLSMYGGLQRKRLSTDCTYDKPVLGYYCNYGPGSTYDVYSYDLAGNIDSVHLGGGSTVARTYGMGNRLLTLGSITYTYDADGNLSTRVAGGVTTNYYWSADGLLDSVHAGTVTLQYSYNAERQLIQRRRNGMAERYFLWDHDHLMLELDTTVTGRVVEYAYLPGVDRPLAYATGATSTPPIMYLQQDAQGNVIGAMDSTGAVRQQLSYDAWGTSTLIGSDPEQRLRWKGMVWEGDSTRMYYVRTRWYDPQSGRFLSEDPAGLQGGLNLYMFGGNDPVNQSDPIGLCSPMPQCLYGWGSLHEQWKAFVAGAQQAANSVVNSIINNLRESLDRTAACLADPVCAVVSTQGGELEGIGEEAGAEAIGGHFAATQLIERSWYSSTFADAWATAYYHLEKHGEGKTLEQYTQDALDFFQQNRGRGQSVILEDGTPGIRIKQKGGPGGYFTPDGKIVTFWYR